LKRVWSKWRIDKWRIYIKNNFKLNGTIVFGFMIAHTGLQKCRPFLSITLFSAVAFKKMCKILLKLDQFKLLIFDTGLLKHMAGVLITAQSF